jgi:hypothetical protein
LDPRYLHRDRRFCDDGTGIDPYTGASNNRYRHCLGAKNMHHLFPTPFRSRQIVRSRASRGAIGANAFLTEARKRHNLAILLDLKSLHKANHYLSWVSPRRG